MEAILTVKIKKQNLLAMYFFYVVLWLCSSCATPSRTQSHLFPHSQEPNVTVPFLPTYHLDPQPNEQMPDPQVSPESYGPAAVEVRPLVLVFGPGVVKGFAHVGVLEVLSNHKIPVGAIMGAEMGALIGAIYATDGNVNHLRWELMKFKEEVFKSEKGFFPSHKLENELSRLFGLKDIRESKIPYSVAFQIQGSSALEIVDRGSAKDALRSAIAFPEILGPGQWKGSPAFSAHRVRSSLLTLVREAKALQLGPVVVIDVSTQKSAKEDLLDADLVIHPDLSGVNDMDFKMKTDAIFRGKKAIMDHLKEFYHWAGMPEGNL